MSVNPHVAKQQLAEERPLVDIHDVLISDVDQHVLEGDLSKKLGKPYLSTDEPSQEQVRLSICPRPPDTVLSITWMDRSWQSVRLTDEHAEQVLEIKGLLYGR